MSTNTNLRASENYHIVLWLVKDLCWVMDMRVLGALMVPPTVLMAMWIAWRSREDAAEMLPTLAVVFWILANATWMLGEFFANDGTRPAAVVLFGLGICCIAWYYLVVRPRMSGGSAH